MSELGLRMFGDILFKALPGLLVITDTVAVHADR